MGEEKQVILKPIRIRRIKYQPLEQTTGTDSDKASRGKEEEAGVEEEEEEEDGREEMERLVGLVPSLMGREGSVSQVRNLESEFVKHCCQYGWLMNPPLSILDSASK